MLCRTVKIGDVAVGGNRPLALIAGPCVIESRKQCIDLAGRLARFARSENVPLIFKASYDKANRTSIDSFRGPGLSRGLGILEEVKERYGIPVLTDVHSEAEVPAAAKVADMLQCPAFLCRQTDLLLALGECGKPVNIKKGQFLAPSDVKHVITKIESTGSRKILVTERGTSFGYNNLVADMRSLSVMRGFGYPVVFDATHCVQIPGGDGSRSGGSPDLIPSIARAGVAAGCDAVFIETHLAPEKALSDAGSMLSFYRLRKLWSVLAEIDALLQEKQK